MRVLLVLGALAAFASSVSAAPAAAAMMDLSTVDCTQAGSMMMKPPDSMMKSDSGMMPASATTDQAFDGMSHMMMHATMMACMELKCGKDAKSRAAAAKLLQQLNDDGIAEAKAILNEYNH